tara:strand:- start:49 stop:267 length:219 start_codon:yes stop_codon:yes gene_type:complete
VSTTLINYLAINFTISKPIMTAEQNKAIQTKTISKLLTNKLNFLLFYYNVIGTKLNSKSAYFGIFIKVFWVT